MSKLTINQKLWYLLNEEQRSTAFFLFCLTLIGVILEMAGLGLILPTLTLLTENDLIAKFPQVKPLLNYLGNPGHIQLVIMAMLTIALVFTIKIIFLVFFTWRQSRFTYGLLVSLTEQLFSGYLHQPYSFHLQRNSAELIRNITSEAAMFTNAVNSSIIILTEGLILVGITGLLFLVEPLGSLTILSIFLLTGWSFYRITRGPILHWGEIRQNHDSQRIQHLQQGLGGVKDVKLLGREENFISQYQFHNFHSARVNRLNTVLSSMPRLWLEYLAVLGLVGLVLIMLKQDRTLDSLLPVLGLFAAAAFRVMPLINRLISAFQVVRYASPVINTLHAELQLIEKNVETIPENPLKFSKSLRLENVNFSYDNSHKTVIKNIDFIIFRGTSVGFIGTTGSGKTTLVDLILGLLSPSSGKIYLDNMDIQTNLREWQNLIGYVPQSIFLTDDTIRRNVAFGLSNEKIDSSALQSAITAANLDSFIKQLPNGLDTIVGERGVRLSGGQRQRIGIARALYHDPEILVLDEATSSLDNVTEKGIMHTIDSLQGTKTILIVAHRLSTVRKCDKLYRLEKGRIIEEGTPETMIHQPTKSM